MTDGYSYTVTNADGRYYLQGTSLSRSVYLSVPAEYEIPTDANHLPAYYKNGDFSDTSLRYVNNFQLTRRSSVDDKFVLAVGADVHIYEDADLTKFKDRSLPDMVNTLNDYCDSEYKECIAIFAGDQVSDNMNMVAPFKSALASKTVDGRKLVFFHCIGNHDFDAQYLLDSGVEKNSYNASKTFVENFGPTDYSFNVGKAHIVVMNNMMVKATGTTMGGTVNCIEFTAGFTDEQLKWLQDDLALVKNPQDKVVVLCVHVPILNKTSKNYQAVAQLLTKFNEGHIVSGHTHRINNYKHAKSAVGGSKIYEHNLQMMGGMWWKTNLSVDGSPAGFGLMKFSGKQLYESVNKTTGAGLDHQIRVYNGSGTYNSFTANAGSSSLHYSGSYNWGDDLKGKFVARVWNADADNWTVEFVKDGVSYPMTRLIGQLDECTFGYSWMFHDCPGGGSRVYKIYTDSFWVIDAPGGNPAKETGWKVVATHKPSASRTIVYERNVLQTDYSGFAYGASYPTNK